MKESLGKKQLIRKSNLNCFPLIFIFFPEMKSIVPSPNKFLPRLPKLVPRRGMPMDLQFQASFLVHFVLLHIYQITRSEQVRKTFPSNMCMQRKKAVSG